MTHPVNLLGWRDGARRACLRFWGGLFAGTWLIVLMLVFIGRSGQQASGVWRELHQRSDVAMLQALQQREQQLRAKQQRQNQWREHDRLREATRGWRSTLTALAELPDQAWLTRLQWQGETLSLTGLASRFPALTQMETHVRRLPGFRRVTPGPVRRDEQGRWQFSYQLERESPDAPAR